MISKELVELVGVLAWPAVAILALGVFQGPLRPALSEVIRRTKKLELGPIGLELAPEVSPEWRVDVAGTMADVRHLTSEAVFDSYASTLFDQLSSAPPADVLVVDLGNGKDWLTTRLYLFSALLERLRGIRTVVFLHSVGGRQRQVLGAASPVSVRNALSSDEPWLEPTYFSAWYDQYGVKPLGAVTLDQSFGDQVTDPIKLEPWIPQNVARTFIRLNQRRTEPVPNNGEWMGFATQLDDPVSHPVWEHTRWINPEALPRPLDAVIDTRSLVRVDPAGSSAEIKRQILLQEGPFVMLVERDGTLHGVVDRCALTDEVVRYITQSE